VVITLFNNTDEIETLSLGPALSAETAYYDCESISTVVSSSEKNCLGVGKKVRSRIRSSLLPTSTLIVAILLTSVTIVFGSTSFYHALIYTSPFFPYSPQRAILILQLLATLSLLVLRESFLMSTEILRWSLAIRGTNLVSFLVLSEATGFWALLRIITTQRRPIFASWRLFAVYKFFVLYVTLMTAQFVWLLEISPRTAYQMSQSQEIDDWNYLGDFGFERGFPYPFSRLDVFNSLSDTSQVKEIAPSVCNPTTDQHCAAYIYLWNTWSVINPDIRETEEPCAHIDYDVPSYVIEFRGGETLPSTLDNSQDPWAYCLNYTTPSRASIRLCMGGENRSSTEDSWVINAGWHFCLDTHANCTEIGDHSDRTSYQNNLFTTTMFIQKAPTNVISYCQNQSIADIPMISNRTQYAINITDFFTAFTAPFMEIPVNFTVDAGYHYTVVNSSANTPSYNSPGADRFVDSLVWAFETYKADEYAALHLRGFLSYALAINSRGSLNSHKFDVVSINYALNISTMSMAAFTSLTGVTIISCIVMMTVFPNRLTPNMASFTEVLFGAKLDESMKEALSGLSNGTSRMIIEKFVDVEIKVGEQYHGGVPRVVISREDVSSLGRGVSYV
jgi:hypothetical protein